MNDSDYDEIIIEKDFLQALNLIMKPEAEFENIRVKGLMTMAPLGASEKELRKVFSSLRELSEEIKSRNLPGVFMEELSMGMSGDFMKAVLAAIHEESVRQQIVILNQK